MIGDVQDQVLTHNSQANQAEITTGNDPRGSADIDAGQTGATVSPWIQSTQVMIGERDGNARIAIGNDIHCKVCSAAMAGQQ